MGRPARLIIDQASFVRGPANSLPSCIRHVLPHGGGGHGHHAVDHGTSFCFIFIPVFFHLFFSRIPRAFRVDFKTRCALRTFSTTRSAGGGNFPTQWFNTREAAKREKIEIPGVDAGVEPTPAGFPFISHTRLHTASSPARLRVTSIALAALALAVPPLGKGDKSTFDLCDKRHSGAAFARPVSRTRGTGRGEHSSFSRDSTSCHARRAFAMPRGRMVVVVERLRTAPPFGENCVEKKKERKWRWGR